MFSDVIPLAVNSASYAFPQSVQVQPSQYLPVTALILKVIHSLSLPLSLSSVFTVSFIRGRQAAKNIL